MRQEFRWRDFEGHERQSQSIETVLAGSGSEVGSAPQYFCELEKMLGEYLPLPVPSQLLFWLILEGPEMRAAEM